MNWRVLQGDVRERLADIPAGSVQTCVTSPPYWGLRDYGHGDQIGLEATPAAYVGNLVAVFAEVRRVLADDGTVWLNLGDSYSGSGKGGNPDEGKQATNRGSQSIGVLYSKTGETAREAALTNVSRRWTTEQGIAPKNLIGIPWRVAFALQADGWYLRCDIIWAKPNPMPESVTDRPTKAHEYLFLLSKNARYYYNAEAVRESVSDSTMAAHAGRVASCVGPRSLDTAPPSHPTQLHPEQHHSGAGLGNGAARDLTGRNKRSVWTVATHPYPDAHFATYPPALIEPCILAGSRPAGKRCDCDEVIATPTGSGPISDPSLEVGRAGFNRPRRPDEGTRPITRREQRGYAEQMRVSPFRNEMATAAGEAFAHYIRTDRSGARPAPDAILRDWLARGWLREPEPCRCPIHPADTVLDPFTGSGTTGEVALRHGRSFVGVELNPAYVELARKRIGAVSPLFASELTA